jgi:formylglycine-generating enzyme required for sulfatase activity
VPPLGRHVGDIDVSSVGDRKLKVFISYSRKDEDFAQDLLTGLELVGFEPYLDKHDIAAGEDWEARLGRLIEGADTVIFVISPDAVASDRCAWEVERTVTLKKRLLPIVWRRVDDEQVPPRLKQLNYIFFDPAFTFGALQTLATALRTDVEWVREHTRIGEAALRWDARGRAEALLFRGDELAAAKTWLASPPQYAQEPTLLHHEFIKAGEDAELARTSAERQRLNAMTVALERENAAQAERETALEQAKLAQEERERALRRGQRALAGAAALFVCMIVGALGWYNQRFLMEQYQWRVVMRPSVLTATQEKEISAKPGSDFKECANGCPTMIVVAAGKFTMGSPETERDRSTDEGRQHEVIFAKPFAVGKTDVTFVEWDSCVAAGECPGVSDNGWGRGDRPVILVSWDEAKRYVAWLKQMTGKEYRLLSEAEWEYAARADNQGRWSFGDDEAKLRDYAWFLENSGLKTQPVAYKKPRNAFGLYDMHGNVWQWVEDPYHDHYDGAPLDGSVWVRGGDASRRVARGGAWSDVHRYLRSAVGSGLTTDHRDYILGFRVARTLTP